MKNRMKELTELMCTQAQEVYEIDESTILGAVNKTFQKAFATSVATKKREPFAKVLAYQAQDAINCPDNNMVLLNGIDYVVYQQCLVSGEKSYTMVYVNEDYRGGFEKFTIEPLCSKIKEAWQNIHPPVEEVKSECYACDAMKGEILKAKSDLEYLFSYDLEMVEEKLYFLAIELLKNDSVSLRKGVWLLSKKSESSLFSGLKICGFDYEDCIRFKYEEYTHPMYEYTKLIVQSRDPKFSFPTQEEFYPSKPVQIKELAEQVPIVESVDTSDDKSELQELKQVPSEKVDTLDVFSASTLELATFFANKGLDIKDVADCLNTVAKLRDIVK